MAVMRRIRIEGLNLSRFLHLAAQQGVLLKDVQRDGSRRLRAVAQERSIGVLQGIAEDGGWQFACEDRIGLAGKSLDAAHRRAALLMAAVLLAVMCWGVTQCVWQIRVEGAGAYEAEVWAALKEMGVRVPMLRRSVDLSALKEKLEWRYPQVAWIECGWRGMGLSIRMTEGMLATRGEEAEVCDVIASTDGIVSSIVTRAGTPVVNPGDVVRKGQVLIRGEERTSAGQIRPVAASGSVWARVWVQAAVQTPMRMVETIPTGKETEVHVVVSPWFPLWAVSESSYEHEDVHIKETPLGGFFFPLKIRTEFRIETDLRSVKADERSVIEEGDAAARRLLNEKAGGGDSLVDIWVNWSIIEDEILLSVATGEMLVDIAQQAHSSGMAATE